MTTKPKTIKEIYTGKLYADEAVLAAAPRNRVQDELVFFNIGKYITDDELEKEYESRGLVPADIYALANWESENQNDPRQYFATHWKDAEGKWCYAAFYRWYDGRRDVDVNQYASDWSGRWVFAGVRKSGTQSSVAKPLHSESLPLVLKINGEFYDKRV